MVRYAPSTKEALAADPSALRIRGVVFDMDGTLATPMKEHLIKMRSDIGVPNGIPTLEYVETCLHGRAREQAEKRIVDIETEAMANMRLSPGLVELLSFLYAHDIPIAIVTRNNINSVNHFINNVVAKQPQEQMKLFAFNPVIDRSFKPIKPHPAAILRISRAWDIPPQQLLMVGDHLDDLLCGLRAGSVSALLRYSDNSEFEAHAHIVVDRIDELVAKLTTGFDADMAISGLDNAST
ncbi:hypothetical protein IWW37_003918 [Coemansia sp. RSA 2050]|nr:hypothetical protein IWW37_003918 [Coemansia sp. RSA 2050]KAJ2737086.1 hypothetical protein IW152_000349 [Coemansia sp. BCRC 34962]